MKHKDMTKELFSEHGTLQKTSRNVAKRELANREIRRLFAEGYTSQEVSEELGVAQKYALRILKAERGAYYDAVGRRYETGLTQEQVGEEFGISRQQVSRILKEIGTRARPQEGRPRTVDYDAVGRRYETGLTQEQVGEEFGISGVQVSRILKELGIEARPRGRPLTK